MNHKGLQWVKNPDEDEVNQVILLKEGEYLLKRTVEIPQLIVVAGQGKVKVLCNIGALCTIRLFVENVEMFDNCDSQ